MPRSKSLGTAGGFSALALATICLVQAGCATKRTLMVWSQPAEAEIWIKGKPGSRLVSMNQQLVGTTPFEAERIAVVGPHGEKRVLNLGDLESESENLDITLRRPGYASRTLTVPQWRHQVALRPASRALASVAPATPAPAAPATAKNSVGSTVADAGLLLRSVPGGATVLINGKEAGKTPYLIESRAGVIEVELSAPGFATALRRVFVPADRRAALELTLTPIALANARPSN
jgi:hypothetical protein